MILERDDPKNRRSKDSDEWETPDSLFKAYDWEFAFTLDAAATKLDEHAFYEEE